MRFGLDLSQSHLDFDEVLDRVLVAESLGFEGAWVGDHFMPNFPGPRFEVGTYLEAWSLLAGLATKTSSIRLGVLVSGVTHRYPAVLAAQAATIDHMSGGRLDIGLGCAWSKQEHERLGLPFPGAIERAQRLDEAVIVLQMLFTQDEARFEGVHYQLHGATYHPRPVQKPHPPIWIGGSGPKLTMPIVARRANGWHMAGTMSDLAKKSALLSELVAAEGRGSASIVRATDLSIEGAWEQVHAHIRGLHDLGFDYLIVCWPTEGRSRIRAFARECLTRWQ